VFLSFSSAHSGGRGPSSRAEPRVSVPRRRGPENTALPFCLLDVLSDINLEPLDLSIVYSLS
jgi:hypothetical protein